MPAKKLTAAYVAAAFEVEQSAKNKIEFLDTLEKALVKRPQLANMAMATLKAAAADNDSWVRERV